MATATDFRDLDVYQRAFEAADAVCTLSFTFPPDERFSLADQIRRSSRSVYGNIAEAWRKRRYVAAFVSKLSDADAEAAETTAWLDTALRRRYIGETEHARLRKEYHRVLGQLTRMMDEPDKWCRPANPAPRARR